MQNIQQTARGDILLLVAWGIFTFFLGIFAVMGLVGVALEASIWACWFMVDSSDPEQTYASMNRQYCLTEKQPGHSFSYSQSLVEVSLLRPLRWILELMLHIFKIVGTLLW